MDEAGHDPTFGFTWSNDPGAVGTYQAAIPSADIRFHFDHILDWNTLCDADDYFDPGICGFHDRIGGEGRRHKNHGGICTCLLDSVLYRVKDRKSDMLSPPFSWSYAPDHIGSIFYHLGSVESTLFSCETLDDNPGIFMYKYRHEQSNFVCMEYLDCPI
jgi:hypothetical protein